MSNIIKSDNQVIFEEKEVRRTWHKEQWFFVINDVVGALTETPNVSDYLKKMRTRDPELNKGWGQLVTPLSIQTKGGKQTINCANLSGIFRQWLETLVWKLKLRAEKR